jgi:hypothetical protein
VKPADDLAQLDADTGADPKSKAEAKGTFNEFDGSLHHENGSRYFPDGNKVSGVNNWLAQEEPVKKEEGSKGSVN